MVYYHDDQALIDAANALLTKILTTNSLNCRKDLPSIDSYFSKTFLKPIIAEEAMIKIAYLKNHANRKKRHSPPADLIIDLHDCSHAVAKLLCEHILNIFINDQRYKGLGDHRKLVIIFGTNTGSRIGDEGKMQKIVDDTLALQAYQIYYRIPDNPGAYRLSFIEPNANSSSAPSMSNPPQTVISEAQMTQTNRAASSQSRWGHSRLRQGSSQTTSTTPQPIPSLYNSVTQVTHTSTGSAPPQSRWGHSRLQRESPQTSSTPSQTTSNPPASRTPVATRRRAQNPQPSNDSDQFSGRYVKKNNRSKELEEG